ncbi:MAG: hypothetical protein JSV03_05260 [Planctomycetota bacterium]|nr:MAG: hypothetical protein JSV03_05260 [Planctomycetota bacterium]
MARILMIMTLLLSFAAVVAFAADSGKRITIVGRAVGTTPAAAEEAKLDALREAVRRVCGSLINAQSETSNFTLIRDKILEQPVGFARVVKIIKDPQIMEGFTQVQLEVEVFPAKFKKRWAEFAHIMQREGNPRCVMIVFEDDDPYDAIPPRPNGLVQTELENFFLQKNVRLMDKAVTDEVRERDLRLAAKSGDAKKAAAAGAAFKADVVLLGEAEAKPGDSIKLGEQTLKRWNVTLVIRAIQTDSAAILVSRTYRPKKMYTTASGSGKDALTRVAKDSAADVLSDVAKAWRRRATVGKMIQLTLEPCTRRQFKAIQIEIIKMKGITGGKDGFRLRELTNSIASIEINWKYNLNQLADRFEELSVRLDGERLVFEVTEQSANRITVRLQTRPLVVPASQSVSGGRSKPSL